jgi:hypothetical protein
MAEESVGLFGPDDELTAESLLLILAELPLKT